MPVVEPATSFASTSVASSTTIGCPPVSSIASTTASQSYVSSSRMPWAMLRGSASPGHMNSQRWGAREWPPSASLDRVEPRQPLDRAERPCLAEGLAAGGRQRAATDLDDHPIQGAPRPPKFRDHLETEPLAALDHEAILVSLAGKRERPA